MASGVHDGVATQRIGCPVLCIAPALLLAACGANIGELTSNATIAPYKEASMLSPVGYSLSTGPNGAIRVTAVGPPGTPAERLEKIALARGAEYGAEQHLDAFTATPARISIRCGKSEYYIKGEKNRVKPADYRVAEVDVSYVKGSGTPGTRPTRTTADQLRAEIAAETVPPETQASLAQEIASQCHR